jgi:hypothetical protein
MKDISALVAKVAKDKGGDEPPESEKRKAMGDEFSKAEDDAVGALYDAIKSDDRSAGKTAIRALLKLLED